MGDLLGAAAGAANTGVSRPGGPPQAKLPLFPGDYACRTTKTPFFPILTLGRYEIIPTSEEGDVMYQSTERFPFVHVLEENWQGILAEYRAVAANPEMHAWPEGGLYD